ncbi:hypothetical protein ACTPEF_24510 [Clostridioides difficile]
MSLYTEWRNLSDNHESQEAEVKFWEEYLKVEAGGFNYLINIFIPFNLNKKSIKE